MSIQIRIDTEWLFNFVDGSECQYFIFHQDTMSIVTMYRDSAMVKKKWTANIGPSRQYTGTYAWEVSAKLFSLVYTHYMDYKQVDLVLYVEKNAIDFHFISPNHRLIFGETDIHIDSTSTWEIDAPESFASVDVPVDMLLSIPDTLEKLTLELFHGNDYWSGGDKPPWSRKNVRCGMVKGEGKTTVHVTLLKQVLGGLLAHETEYVTLNILEPGLLTVEYECPDTGMIYGFIAPVIDT